MAVGLADCGDAEVSKVDATCTPQRDQGSVMQAHPRRVVRRHRINMATGVELRSTLEPRYEPFRFTSTRRLLSLVTGKLADQTARGLGKDFCLNGLCKTASRGHVPEPCSNRWSGDTVTPLSNRDPA